MPWLAMMSLKIGAVPLDLAYFFAILIGTDMVCALAPYTYLPRTTLHTNNYK